MAEKDNKSAEGSEEELDVGGSSGIPLEVEVNDRYLELIEDPYVRQAMGYVSVNDNGEISASKTRQKLLSWFSEHLKGGYPAFAQSRFRILNYLNTIWLAGCENLSPEFWWVNRNSVKRLLYISMVAEALNHLQFNDAHSPKREEIPQAVVFIHDYVTNECGDEVFEELNAEFVELLKSNNELCDVYMKCFGKKEESRSREKESSGKDRHHRKKDK